MELNRSNMPVTYRKIASVTVGAGGAGSIDFTSIPGTYTDLELKLSLRVTGAVSDVALRFNGSTTSYSRRALSAYSPNASSASASDAYIGPANESGYTASSFSSVSIYIPNYAGSTNKSISVDQVQESNQTSVYMNLFANLWSNTAAITSIKLEALSGSLTFAQHSTAVLYGIKKS